MTKEEALDLALEALEMVVVDVKTTPTAYEAHRQAITAIKQARALDKKAENARELGLDYEPATEESSAIYPAVPDHSDELTIAYMSGVHRGKELAAQRQWVGLTDEERVDLWKATETDNRMVLIDAIEAKLKEKNT